MRLWHYSLIKLLPRQQLLGQHRECCAMRGKGWGKKHSVVNYVWTHSYSKLYTYHMKIIEEMKERGYNVDEKWENIHYRGKAVEYDYSNFTLILADNITTYSEHDEEYLEECILNLAGKGIHLVADSKSI